VSSKDETKVLNIRNGTVLKTFLKKKSKNEVEENMSSDSFIDEELSDEISDGDHFGFEESSESCTSDVES
jgi:hypothetical protein